MDRDLLWGLIRLFITLAVLIPALVYITRWYGRKRSLGQSVAVKETIPLGSNKALYVVEWRNSRLLLGVTGQSISVLKQEPITAERETGREEGPT